MAKCISILSALTLYHFLQPIAPRSIRSSQRSKLRLSILPTPINTLAVAGARTHNIFRVIKHMKSFGEKVNLPFLENEKFKHMLLFSLFVCLVFVLFCFVLFCFQTNQTLTLKNGVYLPTAPTLPSVFKVNPLASVAPKNSAIVPMLNRLWNSSHMSGRRPFPKATRSV